MIERTPGLNARALYICRIASRSCGANFFGSMLSISSRTRRHFLSPRTDPIDDRNSISKSEPDSPLKSFSTDSKKFSFLSSRSTIWHSLTRVLKASIIQCICKSSSADYALRPSAVPRCQHSRGVSGVCGVSGWAESRVRRRVKGLSEGEGPAAVRDRGAVPGERVFAALGQRLGVPGLRPCRLCRSQGPGGLPVQPLQAPGRADRWHRVPLDQAAADHLFLAIYHVAQARAGGARSSWRGGSAPGSRRPGCSCTCCWRRWRRARRRSPSCRRGWRWSTPSSAGSALAASAAAVRPARCRCGGGRDHVPSVEAAPAALAVGQGLAARWRIDRRWPSATSPPAAPS